VADASFWKRGSFRSGSNMGSSRSSAGVADFLLDKTPRPIAHRAFVVCEEGLRWRNNPARSCGAAPGRSTLLCWLFPINTINIAERPDWVAHASRVLVLASRRNGFCLTIVRGACGNLKKSSRSRGRARQHAGRVRYPFVFKPTCAVAS
jgi:hypothetical protein